MDKQKILEELGGIPEEIYDQLCVGFIEDAKLKMAEIKSAVEINDAAKMKMSAHSLKGSAGNLRISPIQQAALNLEEAIKNNESQDHLRQLIKALDQAVEFFKV